MIPGSRQHVNGTTSGVTGLGPPREVFEGSMKRASKAATITLNSAASVAIHNRFCDEPDLGW